MTRESMEWLNTQTLIGFTAERGNAWTYRADLQGEPNHYTGPVPVADVRRRLFDWQAESQPIFLGAHGDTGARMIQGRQAIVRSDTGDVLGIFKDGYQPHQYDQWLVSNVETILGDSLSIGSAGLLKGGAQAWVQVEFPENVQTPSGVSFRPWLLAYTSFDGSLATGYKGGSTFVVCDNTFASARSEKSTQAFRLKHTRFSGGKVTEAREALGIVFDTRDEISQEIERLIDIKVPEAAFYGVLDTLIPLGISKRSNTMAEHKRDAITRLYKLDERAATWNGTGFGVLQAFNTHLQHEGIVRGASRAERNMSNTIDGTVEKTDNAVVAALEAALAA